MEDEIQEVPQNSAPINSASESLSSPRWKTSTKRLTVTTLLVLTLLGIYAIRSLLIPIIMAMVLGYVILPIINLLHERIGLSRNLAIALVYLVVVAILIAIPVTTIPQIINQANNLIENVPGYIEDVGEFFTKPLVIGDYTIPLDELPLEQIYDVLSRNLIDIIQTIGRQGFNIFGSVASRTVSTVLWIIIVLVLSLYMVKDYRELWASIVALAPNAYHDDLQRLGHEIGDTWNDFLRGQLILGIVVGTIVTAVALILELPNALALGLLAGILEFIPNIGPTIAALPAVLFALFQSQVSWLGIAVGPVWFAAIVLGLYILIQQLENNFLVPRIIGRSLNLHALIVFIGALAGASIAGVLGILLAAPILASGRIIIKYIYNKLLDLPPFPEEEGGDNSVASRPIPITPMNDITLRPAQPHDKAAITALAAKIWEGEDYLAHDFDDWQAQERGRFIVAYSGNALVGCNKLTEFRPGEWWMEGLRVDPDWRGKGVARLLHENLVRIAAENLTGALRLATDSRNHAVHKLSLDTGFSHINKHGLYKTDIPAAETDNLPFTPVALSERQLVDAWFQQSTYFAACHGLFEDTWKWYEILPRLDMLLEDGRIHWWRKSEEQTTPAEGLVIVHHRDPETMVLNYLDAPNGQWAALMDDVRQLGRTYNVSQIKSKPLACDEIQQAFPHTAWEIDYDLEMWVFQRPIG